MKTLIGFILSVLLLFCYSCSTSSDAMSTKSNKDKPDTIENPEEIQDLTDHLRKFSGVEVIGSGRNASIRIRGVNSLSQSSEPIFVVNGSLLSGGLSQAYDLVIVDNIKSLRVLKSPGEVGIYGIRGANGVIEIVMKN